MSLWSERGALLLAAAAAALPSERRLVLSLWLRRQGSRNDPRLTLGLHVFGVLLVLQALRRYFLHWWHHGARGVLGEAVSACLSVAIRLPGVRGIVRKEVGKELAQIEQKMHGAGDPTARPWLPQEGLAAEAIVEQVRQLQHAELEQAEQSRGRQWAGIYHLPKGPLIDLQNTVWGMCNATNTLYEGVFPSVRKFEAELISWVLHLVNGDPKAGGGILTSGGTESVLLAALAYREQGRSRGICRPRIVAANTCHPAIVKACHYFGMELTKIPVDSSTGFALSAAAVRPYLTGDVVCIYSSAPTFPHGVVDHVEDLAALARRRGIGLHVDNCLGGILLSFLDRQHLTRRHQNWDFRVPGVTSISVDVHKYGNSSKGASVVVFADKGLRQLTYVPICDGCEGLYVTSSLQGSRGGAVIAQAWATMLSYGEKGYMAFAKEINDIYERYQAVVNKIPGLKLLCPCHACIIPIVSDRHNIYAIATLMEERGWNLFTGQYPPVLSICIGELHKGMEAAFEADLRETVARLEREPNFKPKGSAAVYGAMATTPSVVLKEVVRNYVDLRLAVKEVETPKPDKA